ncbi:MAG TPA: DNA polymerase III subunit delta [Limnochordia bacterium]|nr:DNA polymerase III subunit delta [Limnochordia bacterium]
MTVQKLLKEIASKPLPRVLFIHGPETMWHDQIYAALKERNAKDSLGEFNWSVFYGNKEFDIEALLLDLGMVPWGSEARIVVVRNAELVPAALMEKLASWLEKHTEANCLALFLNKVDNRLKYVKILRQFATEIECAPLKGDRLIRYVLDLCMEQGKKMKRDTAVAFLDRVGGDLRLIQNELEKLWAWSDGREEITLTDIRTISSLSPEQIEKDTVFRLTDLIVQEKRQEAMEVLNALMVAGEPALRLLPLIERQLRLILAAKTATGNLDDVARQMGESNSYALKKIYKQAQDYDLQKIFHGFRAVLHADRELKLGGPGDQVLTNLIIKLT